MTFLPPVGGAMSSPSAALSREVLSSRIACRHAWLAMLEAAVIYTGGTAALERVRAITVDAFSDRNAPRPDRRRPVHEFSSCSHGFKLP